jgi:hypothetical protein
MNRFAKITLIKSKEMTRWQNVQKFTREHHQEYDLPVGRQYSLLGVARSVVYYKAHPRDDSELCCLVHKLLGEDQSLGYRMITHYLREYHGMVVNHKRVRPS